MKANPFLYPVNPIKLGIPDISLLFQTQWIFLLLTKNLDKEFITMKENFIKILSLFGIILINII